jgi:hypothetical protein
MASDADDRNQQQPKPQQVQHRFPSDPERQQVQHRFPSDPERQQRELEELRRHFAEVGKRISAFAPATPQEHRERSLVLARSIVPAKQLAPPRWRLVAAVALIFVLGTGVGYALPRAESNDPLAPPVPSTARSPLRAQPQQAQPVPSVPQVCLETTRRGDEMVYLFTIKDRSRRLVQALKAYTLASQACRQAASP